MGVQLQLILTALMVNFGLIFPQLNNQRVDQVIANKINDESRIRENFQNLFDSMAKNNARKSETYHEILKLGVERDQQAFDAMKEELQIAHYRNVHKKLSFYKRNNIGEKFVAAKRAAKKFVPKSDEVVYNKDKYLNPEDAHLGPCFDFIMEAYNANNITKVNAICEEFHRLAGFGYVYVESVHLDRKWLAFQADPNYPPMQIDVLTYEIEKNKRAVNGTIFHITSGTFTDCVFYLEPTKFNSTLFHLTDEVCGVSKAVFQ